MDLQNINNTPRPVVKVCEASVQQATEQDVNCEHFPASSHCNFKMTSIYFRICLEYFASELQPLLFYIYHCANGYCVCDICIDRLRFNKNTKLLGIVLNSHIVDRKTAKLQSPIPACTLSEFQSTILFRNAVSYSQNGS